LRRTRGLGNRDNRDPMTASFDLASLRERVRDATDLVALVGRVVKLKKDGVAWKGLCPFHAEKSPSFVVGGAGSRAARYHCFGCGAGGDAFQFVMETEGLDHKTAVMSLAQAAGIYVGDIKYERPKAGILRQPEKRLETEEVLKKPSLPPLFKLKREECELIAHHRGLDAEAVWIAARVFNRAAGCAWPQYRRGRSGEWMPRCEVHGYACNLDEPNCEVGEHHASWCAIDETRNVAEFRRLDNQPYQRKDDTPIKTWSTAGKSWPLGAMRAPDMRRVLLVEGGPDMLAAYHFLRRWNRVQQVAVVCMLGASNRIREDALPFFKGCRVRIMVDADVPKDSEQKAKRKLVGAEAAVRWSDQLREAGAAVETFYVGDVYEKASVKSWHEGDLRAAEVQVISEGFRKADGSVVKDLNDLALCAPDVVGCDDVRQAMTVWDF